MPISTLHFFSYSWLTSIIRYSVISDSLIPSFSTVNWQAYLSNKDRSPKISYSLLLKDKTVILFQLVSWQSWNMNSWVRFPCALVTAPFWQDLFFLCRRLETSSGEGSGGSSCPIQSRSTKWAPFRLTFRFCLLCITDRCYIKEKSPVGCVRLVCRMSCFQLFGYERRDTEFLVKRIVCISGLSISQECVAEESCEYLEVFQAWGSSGSYFDRWYFARANFDCFTVMIDS